MTIHSVTLPGAREQRASWKLSLLAAAVSSLLTLAVAIDAVAQPSRAPADPATFQRRPIDRELENKTTGTFTIAAVGDVLIQEPVSNLMDPRLLKVLREADTTVGNIESTIIDKYEFARGWAGNFAPADTADDLANMGFDLMQGANNHSNDMGWEGMLSNIRLLGAKGIKVAGTGRNLAQALSPAFHHSPKGRIALLGAWTPDNTNLRVLAATDGLGNIGGSPGINAIRLDIWNVVTRAQLADLKKIQDAIVARRGEVLRPINVPKDDPDRVQIFNTGRFIVGEKTGDYHYEPDRDAWDANVLSVRNAKQYADFVVYGVHVSNNNHAFQIYSSDFRPAEFQKKQARELIDNGLDVYLGNGHHNIQGIELYKGRPIFYNLGNFMVHETLPEIPASIYLAQGDNPFKPRMTAQEAAEVSVETFQHDTNLEALIASTTYRDGELVEIKLYPVDLGIGKSRPWSRMSVPALADGEIAERILTRVQELSKPFGTTIEIENGIGVIRPAAHR